MKKDWTESNEGSFLVGGKPFSVQDASNDDILRVIKGLPSGLEQRTGVFTDWRYEPTPPASESEFAAYGFQNSYSENQNPEDLKQAIRLYAEAGKAYEALGLEQPAANMYSLAAQGYAQIPGRSLIDGRPASEHAVAYFDKAINLHDKQGHEDFSYRDRDKRYNAVAETVLFYRRNEGQHFSEQDAQERAELFYQRLGSESEDLALNSQKIQGELDPEALRVEQKEIGFSNGQRLGTDNVGPCVALMVYSAEHGADGGTHSVVGVAHIDFETDVSSIRTIFESLAPGKKQVRLLGARFEQDPVSQENLCKVVRELSQYDVDIISSDVHQGNEGPSSVVVSPSDFSIREAVSTAGNKTPNASCAYSLITENALYPLRVAFDTRTGSADRSPLFLDSYMVGKINANYVGKDAAELYEELKNEGLYDIGLSSYFIKELLDEYQTSLTVMRDYAQARLPTSLHDRLNEFPVYVGDNADHHNFSLIDKAFEIYRSTPQGEKFDFNALEHAAVELAFTDFPSHKIEI